MIAEQVSRAKLALIVDGLQRVGGAYLLVAFCVERDSVAHNENMETV